MGILTNPNYWDCECEQDYIHPKSQECCIKCNTCSDEQPDSRVEEVSKWLGVNREKNHTYNAP